jgi:hypothetical protein
MCWFVFVVFVFPANQPFHCLEQSTRGTYMQIENRNINVVEQLGVVLDGVTTREENNDFFLQILLQECEQQHESLVGITNDITLF